MRQFRATWTDSANYATKNLERLRAFFRFCMHDDWIAKNPARAVKAPKVTDKPTLPFSQAEMQRILKACDRYPGNRDRLRAFVLVMRYSGLRIGDTISLNEARLRDSKLLLYTAKTGTPVYVPFPPVVMKALVSWRRMRRTLLLNGRREAPDSACELVEVSRHPVELGEGRRCALAPVP